MTRFIEPISMTSLAKIHILYQWNLSILHGRKRVYYTVNVQVHFPVTMEHSKAGHSVGRHGLPHVSLEPLHDAKLSFCGCC